MPFKERFCNEKMEPVMRLLATPKKIIITTHHKPDGDAMGSSLAMYNYLIANGHNATLVVPSDYPEFLYWLPGNEKVVDYSANESKGNQLLAEAEVIFCLDFNSPNRTEEMESAIVNSKATKILIDHHLHPTPFCEHTFSYPLSCATAELVYQFIVAMGDKDSINKEIAECLYCGIMTDTNSFRYETMTAETHRVIAELMDKGAENYKIHENVFDNFSFNRMKMVGYCMYSKLELIPEYKTAYLSLNQDEIKKYHSTTGDTEGVVNIALAIKDVKLAAFFFQTPKLIKISLRSKGVFSVKDIAQTHFNGGGHRNAAGGKSFVSMDETIQKFISILPDYKEGLFK